MNQSLTQKETAAATIHRIESLTAMAKPFWGSMNAAEMLQHCRVVKSSILTAKPTEVKGTLKQALIRFAFLNFIKKLPQGRQAPQRIKDATALTPLGSFEEEQAALISIVKSYPNHTAAIAAAHPVFGPMSTKQWGVFAWIHLDHHLRQFGV